MRSTTGKTYEVVVWATGGVGRYAIRTAADRPNLEFVGAWVHLGGSPRSFTPQQDRTSSGRSPRSRRRSTGRTSACD